MPKGVEPISASIVLYVIVWASAASCALALAARRRVPAVVLGTVAVGALAFFFAVTMGFAVTLEEGAAPDFQSFWTTGRYVWSGGDPVSRLPVEPLPPLNPPTSYPLFAAFALAPQRTAYIVWTALNALLVVALVPLSERVLAARDATTPRLSVAEQGVLAAVLALSTAARGGLQSGQLSIVTAFALLLALRAQGRARTLARSPLAWGAAVGCVPKTHPSDVGSQFGASWGRTLQERYREARPALAAGVWLAVATIKIGTMVPFLLLFRRRADVRSWFVLTALTAGTCLLTGNGLDTPRRIQTWLQTIGKHRSAGQVNDYTYEGPQSADILGLDHAGYRLGLRDRRAVGLFQAVGLIALGLALNARLRRQGANLPDGPACALVALVAPLFLYHRLNDAVILALPLVMVTARARGGSATRWLDPLAALAIVLVLAFPRKLMHQWQDALADAHSPGAHLVQALVLPSATWLILLAFVCVWRATRPPADSV